MKKRALLLLPILASVTLLLSSCSAFQAEVGVEKTPTPRQATSRPTQLPSPTAEPTADWPGEGPPPYPWPPTETPVPTPNAAELKATWTFLLTPKPTPWPAPLVYGIEEAPAEEQEEYFSTTLVVAPFGDGPGEIGYSIPDECCAGALFAQVMAADPQGNLYVLDVANARVVQFDPEGSFVRNLPAPERPYNVTFTVDGESRLYFLHRYPSSISMGGGCYDDAGTLLQHFTWPDGAGQIDGFYVDAQGMLWITSGMGEPSTLEIHGHLCEWMTFPVGRCDRLLDAAEQKAQARPGIIMPSGEIMIVSLNDEEHYVYNEQGIWLYEVPAVETILDLDPQGYLMTVDLRYHRVHKYNAEGQIVASFLVDPDFTPWYGRTVVSQGTICWLHIDLEKEEYRITRWGEEK